MSLLPSAHSEHESHDGRRSAIHLPDGLAAKLLSICDATARVELSEPNSPIHSDLDDLWSNILTSSMDSFRAEEAIRRFAERYGLVHCLSGSNLNWLNEVGNLETPSEGLYKDLLEAAFGDPSGGTAFENEDHDASSQLELSFLNIDEEADGLVGWSSKISRFSPTRDLPRENTGHETPRFYYNRPHTPQIIRIDSCQKNRYDFWAIPNLMEKPSLFPPTLRNIKDWIFWQRVYGRR
ncbi:hypothetical protein BDM02DRAFT_3130551 [Thelephora ganbajun]|uniref:Uncharacterized protein n=1 Tax=Thelephora ganbajun TaxID=370292 RepID=A0ACB6Z9H9_THEGA|nr:hypothetical protein BDM02DRAFT_3130551 [Thelephora ganbajun]